MEGWLEPLYDAAGMGAADRWAIQDQGVPSLELMEAAGRALAEVSADVAGPGPIRVVCGKGNNGGDGLVAARHLVESGYEVEALMLWSPETLSPDAQVNFRLLEGVEVLEGDGALGRLPGSGAIIDAVLGTGFEGEPRSPVSGAIEAINRSNCPVVACDIPSGTNASTGEAGLAVRAGHTVTFHGLKLGHVVSPAKQLCGEVTVADIGIPRRCTGRRCCRNNHFRRIGPAAAARRKLDKIHLRPGLDRRRFARPHGGGLPGGRGGDPLGRRLCDRGSPGRSRADTRGKADRDDDPWLWQ